MTKKHIELLKLLIDRNGNCDGIPCIECPIQKECDDDIANDIANTKSGYTHKRFQTATFRMAKQKLNLYNNLKALSKLT